MRRIGRISGVQLLCSVLSIGLLAVPTALAVRWWPAPIATQSVAPRAEIAEAQLTKYRQLATTPNSGPVILAYHDMARDPSPDARYAVSTENFASQMRMLREAGYTALSSEQLVAYSRGAPIPPRSVVITFDDSTRGMWTQADPVLAANGFRAVCFVITGSIGEHQPYYLRWDELRAMHHSGRWNLEAHTHDGHHRVSVDTEGHTAPFLTHRKLLGNKELETSRQWQQRVARDLDKNIAAFAAHGLPRPSIFAFPFSSISSSTDPQSASTLDDMVKQRFALSVINDGGAGMVTARDISLRSLPRVEVFQQTTTEALFARISALDISSIGSAQLNDPARWALASGEPVDSSWFQGSTIAFDVPAGKRDWLTFAPGATSSWLDYRADVDATNLVGQNTASLEVLSGSDAALRVTMKRNNVKVDRGRAGPTLTELPIQQSSSHHVNIVVRSAEITVYIDEVMVFRGPTNPTTQTPGPRGGIALGIDRQGGSDVSPRFTGLRVRPASEP